MGGFYDSIHVRTDAYESIKDILKDFAKQKGYKFYLSPPINGWISFFPDKYGDEQLADMLAKHLEFDFFRLLVHDDDVFCYWYYQDGNVMDEYNSCPDYFGEEVTEEERERLKGRPEVFPHLVDDVSKIEEIRATLKPSPVVRDIDFPDQLPDEVKENIALVEEVKDFTQDPQAMMRFLSDNPQLFEKEHKEMLAQLLSKGIKSKEGIQEFLEKSEKVHDLAIKITEEFMKSRRVAKESRSATEASDKEDDVAASLEKMVGDSFFVDTEGDIQPPEDLFVSYKMARFAKLLGISNAVTSYEYLAAGETEDIFEWDKFIEIS
jgi:predicted transcriptional regulator